MYNKYLKILREDLPIGESFDILERRLKIGGDVFYRRTY